MNFPVWYGTIFSPNELGILFFDCSVHRSSDNCMLVATIMVRADSEKISVVTRVEKTLRYY